MHRYVSLGTRDTTVRYANLRLGQYDGSHDEAAERAMLEQLLGTDETSIAHPEPSSTEASVAHPPSRTDEISTSSNSQPRGTGQQHGNVSTASAASATRSGRQIVPRGSSHVPRADETRMETRGAPGAHLRQQVPLHRTLIKAADAQFVQDLLTPTFCGWLRAVSATIVNDETGLLPSDFTSVRACIHAFTHAAPTSTCHDVPHIMYACVSQVMSGPSNRSVTSLRWLAPIMSRRSTRGSICKP